MAAVPIAEAAGQGDVFYDQALVAMRSENYNDAIKLFAQAQRAGIESAALHYNSGVAYYKLGDYPRAKQSFIKAQQNNDDGSALARYNLGLTYYRLQQNSEARRWFLRVVAESSNPQLVEMADEMVSKLDERSDRRAVKTATASPWRLAADLFYGYDDNVTLENVDLVLATNLQDNYFDLYGTLRYQIHGDNSRGSWLALTASSLQYQQYNSYDYNQYDLALFRDSNYGRLDTRTGLRISRSQIGGSDYLQKYTLRVQGEYPLGESHTAFVRYDISRYDPINSAYNYLAGLKGSLSLESHWRSAGRKFKLGYELENNSREDYNTAANFISYSASRHEFSASATLLVIENWHFILGGDYRKSRYNDVDVIAGVPTLRREDDRWRANIGIEYRINRYLDLAGEYYYTDNDSNVVSRRYQRNQYSLGLRGYF